MGKQELTITWEGITIGVTHTPDYSPALQKVYGWALAHLSIQRQGEGQLPMTGTGYKSHFTSAASIAEMGGLENYVRAWLDESGASEKWRKYASSENQLRLF